MKNTYQVSKPDSFSDMRLVWLFGLDCFNKTKSPIDRNIGSRTSSCVSAIGADLFSTAIVDSPSV